MTSILITAFEPYDEWTTNASWLALVELTRSLPSEPQVTTRRYPVDFQKVRERLTEDLAREFDFVISLGQAPGETSIVLEAVGLNVRSPARDGGDFVATTVDGTGRPFGPLVEDGPLAYASQLPLAALVSRLRSTGIPARVSHHAGTYVCNATFYLAHFLAERMALKTRIGFIHLPLETTQVAADGQRTASMPASITAAAIHEIITALAETDLEA